MPTSEPVFANILQQSSITVAWEDDEQSQTAHYPLLR